MNVENVIDEMLEDLNAVNDEFINSYFDEEEIVKPKEITEVKEETFENIEEQSEIEEANNEQVDYDLKEELVDNSLEENIELEVAFEEQKEEKPKTFSYNEILDRLDRKEKIDINNPDDILSLIGDSNNSEEFFEELEKVSENDK